MFAEVVSLHESVAKKDKEEKEVKDDKSKKEKDDKKKDKSKANDNLETDEAEAGANAEDLEGAEADSSVNPSAGNDAEDSATETRKQTSAFLASWLTATAKKA